MRTDDPNPAPPPAWARLRARLAPARRWLAGRRPGARRAALLAPLALLVAAAYYFAADEPVRPAWLYDRHRFPPDEAQKVARALAARGVAGVVLDEGKVGVPPAREAEALAALEKARLAPRSATEIAAEAPEPNFLASQADREFLQKQRRERALGQMIRELDESIESAIVETTRPRPRPFGPPEPATAAVRVTTSEDRPLPPQTIEKIQAVLVAWEHLPPDGVTVFDRRGTLYLSSGSPAHHVHSQARAEEYKSRIRDELDWIRGIKVSVLVERVPPRPPRPEPKPAPPRAPVVIPNAPASLPEPAPGEAAAEAVAAPPDEPGAAAAPGKANVLVQVPLSFYLHHSAEDARREPASDELRAYVDKVEKSIRMTVAHVIPGGELGTVEIARIDPPAAAAAAVPAYAEPHRLEAEWALAAGVGVLAALAAVAVGGGVLVGRRPSARPDRRRRPDARVREDGPGAGPAPSERVRELVRRDPEAAAGVLQRWIGQGGDAG